MAFGKRSVVSDNINDFSVMLVGESGIGKSTVMSRMCEKLFGPYGYLLLNTGDEDGVAAIDGVTYEDVPTYKKFVEVANDIIKNKEAEYPELKVVIVDTLDQLIDVTEKAAIDNWNRSHAGQKNFTPAKTTNAIEGGFGASYGVVFNMIYDKVRALDKVGVKTFYICHSKNKEIIDPLTGTSYTTLSSNMAQRYFNDFKSKVAVVGVACIDRTIQSVGTGRKDIMTKKEIEVKRIQDEVRQIVFRDDSYSVDAKSRFSGIVDRIPLDADEFIKALKDAIASSKTTSSTTPTLKKTAPEVEEEPESIPVAEETPEEIPFEEDIFDDDKEDEVVETSDYPEDLLGEIKKLWAKEKSDAEKAAPVKAIVKPFGRLIDVDEEGLKKIYDILK